MKKITNETRLQTTRLLINELNKSYSDNFSQFTESMQNKILERLKQLKEQEAKLMVELGYK